MHTPQQLQEALEKHRQYLAGLVEGWLGTFDLANPGMTIEQAIDIERKNVAWLEQKLQEVK